MAKKKFQNSAVEHERQLIYKISYADCDITATISDDGEEVTVKPKHGGKDFVFIDSDPDMLEAIAECLYRAYEIADRIREGEEDV